MSNEFQLKNVGGDWLKIDTCNRGVVLIVLRSTRMWRIRILRHRCTICYPSSYFLLLSLCYFMSKLYDFSLQHRGEAMYISVNDFLKFNLRFDATYMRYFTVIFIHQRHFIPSNILPLYIKGPNPNPLWVQMSYLSLKLIQWRHNERDGVSDHQPHDCLLNRLFGCRSKKTSKLRVTGLWEGNSPVTGECPAQRASNAGNVSIWWRHHVLMVINHFR